MGNFESKIRDTSKGMNGYYQHDVPYPSKKDWIIKCDCGCPNCKASVYNEEGYRKALNKYRDAHSSMVSEMKKDMFEDLGIEKHPAKDLMYSYAYDKGHSSGYHEVFMHLQEISEFVDDVVNVMSKKED